MKNGEIWGTLPKKRDKPKIRGTLPKKTRQTEDMGKFVFVLKKLE